MIGALIGGLNLFIICFLVQGLYGWKVGVIVAIILCIISLILAFNDMSTGIIRRFLKSLKNETEEYGVEEKFLLITLLSYKVIAKLVAIFMTVAICIMKVFITIMIWLCSGDLFVGNFKRLFMFNLYSKIAVDSYIFITSWTDKVIEAIINLEMKLYDLKS